MTSTVTTKPYIETECRRRRRRRPHRVFLVVAIAPLPLVETSG
jgi:hypothetical protein